MVPAHEGRLMSVELRYIRVGLAVHKNLDADTEPRVP
jgi:hypothetical protein